MTQRVYVLAGNYHEYLKWRFDNRDQARNSVYVDDYRRIFGVRNPDVIRVGSFYARSDIDQIEEAIRSAEHLPA